MIDASYTIILRFIVCDSYLENGVLVNLKSLKVCENVSMYDVLCQKYREIMNVLAEYFFVINCTCKSTFAAEMWILFWNDLFFISLRDTRVNVQLGSNCRYKAAQMNSA